MYIDVIPSFNEADAGAGGPIVVGGATGGIQAQLLAIQSQSSQIRRELQELRANQMADRAFSTKSYAIINANIRRIALQPGVRGGTGGTVARGNDDDLIGARPLAIAGLGAAPASLSPTQKTCFIFGKSIKSELEAEKRQNTSVNRSVAAK